MKRADLFRAVDAHLAHLAQTATVTTEPRFGAWHAAAAVLHTFDESLRPADGVSGPDEEFDDVLDSAAAVRTGGRQWRYELDPGVRRSVLRQLGTRAAMQRAREANPGAPVDAVQEALDACIAGKVPPLEEQGERELAALFQAAGWLHGVLRDVPDQAAVRTALDRIYLLAPFEGLVRANFRGRAAELAQLRDYVGVLPTSAWSWLKRQAAEIASWHEKPPLVIYGPGGIGKSTLVSKFVLDHATVDEDRRFPFVYLDYDRPDLAAAEPLTILMEAVRQLGIQWPNLRPRADSLRRLWAQQIADAPRNTGAGTGGKAGPQPSGTVLDRSRYLEEFAEFIHRPEFAGRPLLLVLDTFEEVQVRSQAAVEQITGFLQELQKKVPRLRAVFSGRSALEPDGPEAPSGPRRTEHIPLQQLDPEAAAAILRADGMPEPHASRTASWVGGHPLDLQLASELLRRLCEECGGDQERALELFAQETARAEVEQGGVQRFLYGRILAHIRNDDERVVALAHPGLVLRRITPALILEVLAEPCGIPVADLPDAEKLLKALGQEVALVTTVGELEVRHRPDVRKLMLKAMAADRGRRPVMERIHALAVDFYARQYEATHAAADRAEELYHRLSLDQPPEQLEQRWIGEAQPLLFTVVDELPPAARAWLSTRLRIELDPQARKAASLAVWERDAERRAAELLQFDQAERALQVLRERDARTPASPLFALEARALEATGDQGAAMEVVDAGIGQAFRVGADAVRLDLLLLGAEIEWRRGRLEESGERLTRAELLARQRGDRVAQLRAAAARLELASLQAGLESASPAPSPSLAARGPELLDALSDAELRLAPEAARRVAAELGAPARATLARVVRVVGVGVPDPRQLAALGRALERWDAELAAGRAQGAAGINTAALRKVLEQNFSREELVSLFGSQGGPAVLASSESPALSVIAAYDRVGALDGVVETLEGERRGVTASVRRSTGPIAHEFDLQNAPDGTLESYVLAMPTLLSTPLGRVLEKFTPPAAVLDALSATLRGRGDRGQASRKAARSGVAVRLSAGERDRLRAALVDAFPTYEALRTLLYFGLDQNLEAITAPGRPLETTVRELVAWAERTRRLPELVSAAGRERPDNALVQQAVALVGLSTDVAGIAAPGVLQRLVGRGAQAVDVDAWRRNLGTLEGRVCLLRLSSKQEREILGTGFLVAPDLVLTSRGVLPPEWGPRVTGSARFDYRAVGETVIDPGVEVPLAAAPVVDEDEAGEYALLRLAYSIGLEPAGGSRALPTAPPRGWFVLPTEAPSIPRDGRVLVLQNGDAGPVRLSLGSDARLRDAALEYRVATEAGAAGAPVFLSDLQLVGVHQGQKSSWPLNARRGTGTSIAAIVERLRAKGLFRRLPRVVPGGGPASFPQPAAAGTHVRQSPSHHHGDVMELKPIRKPQPAMELESMDADEPQEHSRTLKGSEGSETQERSRSLDHIAVKGKSDVPLVTPGGALESVIGIDERVRILDTDLSPWRMICALRLRGPKGMAVGTGWFVGPRTLLTAGHCVYSTLFFGGWVETVEVSPGRNGATFPFGTVKTTRVSSVDRWVEKEDADFDIGCIHLDEPLGKKLGWFSVGALAADELKSFLVNVSGYPADRGAGTEQYHHRNRIKEVTGRRVFYDVDTAGGQSGAPVWIHKTPDAPPLAIGIHAYGTAGTPANLMIEANSAPRIIPEVLAQIEAWIQEDGGL